MFKDFRLVLRPQFEQPLRKGAAPYSYVRSSASQNPENTLRGFSSA
jgi:hypothetical protein